MDELVFYLKEGKPTVVTNVEVMDYLKNSKLKLTSTTYIDNTKFILLPNEVIEDVKKKMCINMSDFIMPKLDWETQDLPEFNSKVVIANVNVMTNEDILEMLSHFGVNIQK